MPLKDTIQVIQESFDLGRDDLSLLLFGGCQALQQDFRLSLQGPRSSDCLLKIILLCSLFDHLCELVLGLLQVLACSHATDEV